MGPGQGAQRDRVRGPDVPASHQALGDQLPEDELAAVGDDAGDPAVDAQVRGVLGVVPEADLALEAGPGPEACQGREHA